MNTPPRPSPREVHSRLRLGLLTLIAVLLFGVLVVENLPGRRTRHPAAYQALPVSIQAGEEADYSRIAQAPQFQPVDLGILDSIVSDGSAGLPEGASLEELRSALQSPVPTMTLAPGQAALKSATATPEPPGEAAAQPPTNTAAPTASPTATASPSPLPSLTATATTPVTPWSPTATPTPKKKRPPADTQPAPEPTRPPQDTPAPPPPTAVPQPTQPPPATQVKATDVPATDPPRPTATDAPKPTSAPTPSLASP